MPRSPYQILLGDRFGDLAPCLQDFHGSQEVWKGEARFDVWRLPGLIPSFLAWMGGLPPPGRQVPLTLTIRRDAQGESWDRQFGNHKLPSFQWAGNGLLYERFPTICLGQKLEIEQGSLRLRVVKSWKWGIPLPSLASPSGTGLEIARGDKIDVCARAFFPFLGELVRYEGLMSRASPNGIPKGMDEP